MSETKETEESSAAADPLDELVMPPDGATHYDDGLSNNKWIRVSPNTHDYWDEVAKRWITFEAGEVINRGNKVRRHWEKLADGAA